MFAESLLHLWSIPIGLGNFNIQLWLSVKVYTLEANIRAQRRTRSVSSPTSTISCCFVNVIVQYTEHSNFLLKGCNSAFGLDKLWPLVGDGLDHFSAECACHVCSELYFRTHATFVLLHSSFTFCACGHEVSIHCHIYAADILHTVPSRFCTMAILSVKT